MTLINNFETYTLHRHIHTHTSYIFLFSPTDALHLVMNNYELSSEFLKTFDWCFTYRITGIVSSCYE